MKKLFFLAFFCFFAILFFAGESTGKLRPFPSPDGKKAAYIVPYKDGPRNNYFTGIDIEPIPFVSADLITILFNGDGDTRSIPDSTSFSWSSNSRYLAFRIQISEGDWTGGEVMVCDTNLKTPKDKRLIVVGKGWVVHSFSFKGMVLTANIELDQVYDDKELKKYKCSSGAVNKMVKIEKDFSKLKKKEKKTLYNECGSAHD